MTFPFSREQFFALFAAYNSSVWPAQLVLLGLATAGVIGILVGRGWDRAIGWILAVFWGWMGIAYHAVFFTRINSAAWVFGAAFVVGAYVFGRHAQRGTLRFGVPDGVDGAVAVALLLYSFVGYPMLGALAGHAYPRVPTFGLPCPTTIFTLGILLLARRPVPGAVWLVPLAWSVVGSVAAFKLDVPQDLGLLAAAFATAGVLVRRAQRTSTRTPSATRSLG